MKKVEYLAIEEQILTILCPPLSMFAEPPYDQYKYELVECPHCKNEMWLSEEKSAIKNIYEEPNKIIFFSCYLCVKSMFEQNYEPIKRRKNDKRRITINN